jgi:hypothetical protein
MAPSKATVTAVIGIAKTITSAVFNDVKKFIWNIENGSLDIEYGTPKRYVCLDAAALSSVTHTVASGVHTITVS